MGDVLKNKRNLFGLDFFFFLIYIWNLRYQLLSYSSIIESYFFFLQYLCRIFLIVDEYVKEVMGDNFYDLFMVRENELVKIRNMYELFMVYV